MISTRENLLVRPWQQRKYEHHKKKVLAATPAIDTKCPPFRGHVAVKLKKLQREQERAQKIERDNMILLQKLNYIMTTHWVDNYLAPQPTFLSRVGMYRPSVDSGIDFLEEQHVKEALIERDEDNAKCRKVKCLACSPLMLVESLNIPEERVPWEPQKKSIRKRRSRSVPPKVTTSPLIPAEKPKSAETKASITKSRAKNFPVQKETLMEQPNSICLARGSLKLSVNFPADTVVKFDCKRAGKAVCRCSRGFKAK